MKFNAKALIFILALIVLAVAVYLRMGMDTTYSGWGKYTDEQDGYRLYVPPEWELLEENSISGFRGVRVFKEQDYATDVGTLTVFAVYSRPLRGGAPAESRLLAYANQICSADLKQYDLKKESESESETLYLFEGVAFIESIKAAGAVRFIWNDSTLAAIVRIIPQARAEELNTLFANIDRSVEFVPEEEE